MGDSGFTKYTKDGPVTIHGTPAWRLVVVIIILGLIVVSVLDDHLTQEKTADSVPPAPAPEANPAPPELTAEQKAAQQAAKARQREQERIERERQRAEKYEACKTDLQCWGDRHSFSAIVASQDIIERMAKYDFEWVDGFWGVKLTRFSWLDKSQLTLRYYGDQIKLQNGFGAWQRYIYVVDYDPINDRVLDVAITPGRLK